VTVFGELIYVFVLASVLVGLVMGWMGIRFMRPPRNHPGQFALERARRNRPETVVVCAGDSLTHGVVSANYVELLEERLSDDGFFFVNAGINGDMAYNLRLRLEPIIACQPDFVTVLIGTNDVNAIMSEGNQQRYVKSNHLPREPNLEWYTSELESIVKTLQARTSAHIAILSPPVLGEELYTRPNRTVATYASAARDVARRSNVTYIPLFELMCEELDQAGHQPLEVFEDGLGRIVRASLKVLLLRQSFDAVSDAAGYYFLTDGIHLNSRGAKRVAGLIERFLEGEG